MLDLYKNIKNRRLELNMTQSDLAKKMGYSDKSMIAKIEKGSVDLSQSKISAFAKALDTTEIDLMGWNNVMSSNIDDKSVRHTFVEEALEHGGLHLVSAEDLPGVLPVYKYSIPVYQGVACGTSIDANKHAEYYTVSKESTKVDFAVIANDDSMVDARIHNGDTVFMKKCDIVDNGEIAAVRIDGTIVLKRVYHDADRDILTLISENKAYAPIVLTKDDTRSISIMGRAVCAQIFF